MAVKKVQIEEIAFLTAWMVEWEVENFVKGGKWERGEFI